jgi:hypothetical protein
MQTQRAENHKVEVPENIEDSGKVRLGGHFPSLPPVRPTPAIEDSGKVRLGGHSPAL